MQCPHCHAPLAPDASTCHSCGLPLLHNTPAWQAAQRRYRELLGRYTRGELDEAAFQQAHADLTLQDGHGRYWLPGDEANTPFLWDGQAWKPQPAALAPAPSSAAAPPPTPPPTPAYAAQQAPISAPPTAPVEPKRRHRLRGCCLGTLILLLLACSAGVFISPLPQRWGWRASPAEKAFAPEPDRAAAVALAAELEDAGMDTTGLYMYVLPYRDGREGSALYAILDSSRGFQFPASGAPDAVVDYMTVLAASEAVELAGVKQIAIDYRDPSGQPIAVLTASTDAVLAFSRGEMPPEEFMQLLEGRIDLAGLTGGTLR